MGLNVESSRWPASETNGSRALIDQAFNDQTPDQVYADNLITLLIAGWSATSQAALKK